MEMKRAENEDKENSGDRCAGAGRSFWGGGTVHKKTANYSGNPPKILILTIIFRYQKENIRADVSKKH